MERWIIYAFVSMFFAGFTSVVAKQGLVGISAELGLTLRTVFVFFFVLLFGMTVISKSEISLLRKENFIWLGLSGVTTALSWIFYYKALKLGDVATVALIDKGSVIVAVFLAWLILKEVITALRDTRNKQQIKPKEAIALHIQTDAANVFDGIMEILSKQVNAKSISFTNEPVAGSITSVIGKDKFYIETEQPLDSSQQKNDLLKELNHLQAFLVSVEKKLGNEKFVQNAKPEILALEQKKKSDAAEKIKVIEESLATL